MMSFQSIISTIDVTSTQPPSGDDCDHILLSPIKLRRGTVRKIKGEMRETRKIDWGVRGETEKTWGGTGGERAKEIPKKTGPQ